MPQFPSSLVMNEILWVEVVILTTSGLLPSWKSLGKGTFGDVFVVVSWNTICHCYGNQEQTFYFSLKNS